MNNSYQEWFNRLPQSQQEPGDPAEMTTQAASYPPYVMMEFSRSYTCALSTVGVFKKYLALQQAVAAALHLTEEAHRGSNP